MKHNDLRSLLGVPGISPGAQSVLLALAIRADQNGKCFPTVACIQVDTGLSRASVLRNIKELSSKGLLGVTLRHKRSSVYLVKACPTDTSTTETCQTETSKGGLGSHTEQLGSHTDTQNKNTELGIKIELGNSGVPQMNIEDTLKKFSEPESDEDILKKKTLEQVFRHGMKKYFPDIVQPELKVKEKSQLKKFGAFCKGDPAYEDNETAKRVMLTCIRDWMAFNVYAEDKYLKGVGLIPTPGALLLGVVAAINFTAEAVISDPTDSDAKF